jgi:hypothetical protein
LGFGPFPLRPAHTVEFNHPTTVCDGITDTLSSVESNDRNQPIRLKNEVEVGFWSWSTDTAIVERNPLQ